MYNRLLLSMLMAIFLVACGQDVSQESNEDQTDIIDVGESQSEKNQEDRDSDSNADLEDKKSEEEASKENEEKNKETVTSGALANLSVHYINVGQADATLLQYDGHSILLDTGDWRGNEVVNYLKSQGVTGLDLVIGSHPDADHIGQLADVMNAFNVSEVWLSGNESTSQTFQRGLEAVLNSGADYQEPRAGEEFEIGPMNITVVYPEAISGASNEESISLLFTYGDVKFLFTGDADKNGEKQMVNSGINIDADILQLGHHGSSTSSDASFINTVSPDVAIYSAGTGNSYGHPHAEVVSLIQNAGIKLYGTDVHGTIIVTTDGKDYTIKTKSDGTITPKNTGSNNDSSSSSSSNTDTAKEESNSSNEQQAPSGSCVNINTASFEAVQQIIHIGPERAQDLIDLRPFNSVSDLDRIKGIGPARIKDIEAQGIACVK